MTRALRHGPMPARRERRSFAFASTKLLIDDRQLTAEVGDEDVYLTKIVRVCANPFQAVSALVFELSLARGEIPAELAKRDS